MFRGVVMATAFVLLVTGRASAHPAPFSYLDIVFRNGGIEGTLVVHVIDVAHELRIDPPETLLAPGVAESRRDQIAAILSSRLLLQVRSGLGESRQVTPVWTSVQPMQGTPD